MAEKSSFFNSVSGDRKYKAEDWAAYFATFVSNGVVLKTNATLNVSANGGSMSVTLGVGSAIYNGYRYENTEPLSLTIPTAHASLNRIDAIMIRWNRNIRAMNAYVVQGTAATPPAAPTPGRTADIGELCVATVYVAAGATSIAQSVITDRRLDTTVCGIATMIGDLDTTTLYAQIAAELAAFKGTQEADFAAWFASIQDILDENTAGNLLNMIQALQTADTSFQEGQSTQDASISSLVTSLAAKLGWTQLWSGAWGGSGSSPITVANLSNYTVLAFVIAGVITFVLRAGSMHLSFQYCSAAGLMVRAYNIGSSGNVLNVNYAYQLLATGSTATTTVLTNDHISGIYGVK